MCILIATIDHPKYPLILLSNRDEYFDRPTRSATFWEPPHDSILAPYDLAREEHGTWIGINKNGRLAVVLNCHEDSREKAISKVSRGIFPKQFLLSDLTTKEWVQSVVDKYGQEGLAQSGGFTMFCGEIFADVKENGHGNGNGKIPEENDEKGAVRNGDVSCNRTGENGHSTNNITHVSSTGVRRSSTSTPVNKPTEDLPLTVGPFVLFSNRQDDSPYVLSENDKYLCVSNGMGDDSWVKTTLGEKRLFTVVEESIQNNWTEEELIEHLFGVLSTDTFPQEEPTIYNLRKSVFIPPVDFNGESYGTRTQTIILVDKDRHVTYLEKNKDQEPTRFTFTIQ